jgi:hypothetical protein
MEQDDQLLSAAAGRVAERERTQLGAHPTADRMHGYLEGKLDSASRSELQEHLSVCAVCTEELLQLEEFQSGEVSEAELSGAAERWPSVRSRLVAEGLLPGDADKHLPRDPLAWPAFRFPFRVSWALAGLSLVLLVTTLYLAFQVLASRGPKANVAIADLIPMSDSRRTRGGVGPEEVVIPKGADRVLLRLNVLPTESYPSYELEIRDGWKADGRLRWAAAVRDRTHSGNFNVDLEKSFLPEGQYLLRLFGVSGGRHTFLGEYHVRILHER